ncbi:MAG: hypothetical protein M3N95_03950 [Actinomycetota bacterium]|nr:hypothetical protein [Actinomycetota bacterium]
MALGVSLAGAVVAVPSANASGTIEGCPSGYACLYPQNAGWNGGHPSFMFYTYGYHNLTNQFGTHRTFNNQTGGASMYGCSGYGGSGTLLWGNNAGGWSDQNLTPTDSVVLNQSGGFTC